MEPAEPTLSVDAIKRRDCRAWSRAYDLYAADLYGFLFHLVKRDRAVAEDLNQEAWLAAIDKIEQFRADRGDFRTWLFVIARNRAALHYRRLAAHGAAEPYSDSQPALAEDREVLALPEDLAECVEREDIVRSALCAMDPDAREALIAKYVDGLSVEAIAARIDRTPKATESLLSRSRARSRRATALVLSCGRRKIMNASEADPLDPEERVLVELLGSCKDHQAARDPQYVDRLRREIVARTSGRSAFPRWRRSAVVAAAAAAAVLLIIGFQTLRPRDSWAQVVEAVRERPWVHAVVKNNSPGGPQESEQWWSASHGIFAVKSSAFVQFDDFRAGTRHRYLAARKQLERLPAVDAQKENLQAWTGLFAAILHGDEKLGDSLAEFRIVSQRRSTVEREGRTWTEYELQIQRGALPPSPLTIQVDPATKLPVSMTVQHTDGGKLMKSHFDFSFPEEGPADIFALGVPRDATLDDHMPSPELAAVLKIQKQSRTHEHAYFAVFSTSGGLDKLIWRKGDRWRVDICWPNKATWTGAGSPAADTDLAAWLKQFHHSPLLVCNGRAIYRNVARSAGHGKGPPQPDWKVESADRPGPASSLQDVGECMLEREAYPALDSWGRSAKVQFDPRPDEGPPGTVLLSITHHLDFKAAGSEPVDITIRHWLDPRLGYAVVQRENVGVKAFVLEDFVQSPAGIWYPTRYRRNYELEEKTNGERSVRFQRDPAVQFRYDFKADLPDDLFEPK